MAQGLQSRLRGLISGSKQLLTIAPGVPIVGRTVELLRVSGVEDIVVIARATREWRSFASRYGVRISTLAHAGETLLDGLHASAPIWAKRGRTIVVLADVVFSRGAFPAIVRSRKPLAFLGRNGPSRVTGCPWGELFAFAFTHRQQRTVKSLLDDVRLRRDRTSNGGIGKLWSLLRVLEQRYARLTELIELNDYMDDIDDAFDLASLPVLAAAASEDDARARAGIAGRLCDRVALTPGIDVSHTRGTVVPAR